MDEKKKASPQDEDITTEPNDSIRIVDTGEFQWTEKNGLIQEALPDLDKILEKNRRKKK